MDSIKAEKLQTMKNLILHSLTALICTLFCSYPYWFPHLRSSVKHFVFVSLPNPKSFFFSTKCVFIVGNAIIIFLVGESKLASPCSSPARQVYDEYVERSRSIREASTHMERKEEEKSQVNFTEESVNKIEDKYMVENEKGEEKVKDDDHDKEEEEERDEEEEPGLPTEELNKRVEDFIARVKRQSWLEARLVNCGRG